MKKAILCMAILGLSGSVVAHEQIQTAIGVVMSQSCLSNRRVARSVPGWGVPQRLWTEPSFTNLVRVVESRVNSCEVSFVSSLTNDVQRAVFMAALTACGQTVYKNAVVRWFGGADIPAVSPELMEEFASPAGTSMEAYFIRHYNEPGISNVWVNIKARYTAIGEMSEAAGIDDVLNGKSKAEHEMLDSLESGR